MESGVSFDDRCDNGCLKQGDDGGDGLVVHLLPKGNVGYVPPWNAGPWCAY